MKAYDLFFISTEKVDFGFGCGPILPPFFPIAIYNPKKEKRFILATVFSELLHSKINLTQWTENQLKQPIYVCGPTTVGSKLGKVKSHLKKEKWHDQHVFACYAKENTF